jgi:transcriptional pleiotropic regulator of transition state genes
MKSTGMTRPIDQLGRVTLPVELRNTLDLKEDDRVEIFVDGEMIILKKYRRGCICCNSFDELTTVGSVTLCHGCIRNFAAVAR